MITAGLTGILVQALVPPFQQSTADALAQDPEHPRLLWVVGANQWVNPPERGGGQDLAIPTSCHHGVSRSC